MTKKIVLSIALAALMIWWLFFSILPSLFLAGCATPQPQPIILQPTPTPVAAPAPTPIPPDPRTGLSPEILNAIANPEHPTVKQGMAVIYPYSQDTEWKLSCATLRATEIRLNHDEEFEQAALGDTTRWSVQGVDHTVLIKALGDSSDPKMQTNLIIGTTKRSYHLNLRLGHFTPAVGWYYPGDFETALQAHNAALKGGHQ